jgi:sigma-B regulation protein RsbU (phosphoserine phosphatase)
MTEQILLPPRDAPRRIYWKPWKWIGLAVFAIVLAFGRWLPAPIPFIGYLYGIAVIANLLISIFRYLKDRFFWRVRNRLIGSYIFVGVIPLLILLGVVALSAYMLLGQLGWQYLDNALRENERLISRINTELAEDIASAGAANASLMETTPVFSKYAAQFPRLAARLLRRRTDGSLETVSKKDPHSFLRDLMPHPGDKWRGGSPSFEGLLRDRTVSLITSLQPVPGAAGLYVETSAPLDSYLEDRLRREKSLYINFYGAELAKITGDGKNVQVPSPEKLESSDKEGNKLIAQRIALVSAQRKNDSRGMVYGIMLLKCKIYESGKDDFAGAAVFSVPWEIVLKIFLGQDLFQSRMLLGSIFILFCLFVFSVLVSLVIGFIISRHITRSVHDIYQGILALQKGDLQHRIPERRKDQLGLLAYSFNQMSASMSHLLEEVVEKKRLEQELEIAREVQATLFPKQLPHPPGMSVFGGCKPARVVSGDYYDFIVEDEKHLYIIVGDISGKGISAALLMANLQAAMRNQLLSIKHYGPETVGQRLADVMTQLNRQVFLNSPAAKYATLFLSRYDADTRRLWYCNAGHPPPIVLSQQGTQTLKATGMAVGMFPDVTYQAEFVDLQPGALLAIFSDGATEAVNGADEEFGERRVMEALQQSFARSPEDIWDFVVSKVEDWRGGLPQADDITLIVSKTDNAPSGGL